MLGSKTSLPPPSAFASETRPLRLTSEAAWVPPPSGSCHYVLLHPYVPNQRCSCQSFVRNPRAPGTACDCGHQSCYHSPSNEGQTHSAATSTPTETSLLNRISRLEEIVQHERESRETTLERERSTWAREIRVLRETLVPFYESERQMHRKLVELEDRIEGNYDEQVRLRERIVAIDDSNMGMEKRIDDLENNCSKRRRISRLAQTHVDPRGSTSSDDRRVSSMTEKTSDSSVSSQALSPDDHISPPLREPEEPRSSGILNLFEMAARPRNQRIPIRYTPPSTYEARSSGFLALDLADRFARKRNDANDTSQQTFSYLPAYSALQSPPDYAQSDPDTTLNRPSLSDSTKAEILRADLSPRKRKHVPEHMALDVLADVSMASPLVHG